MVLYEEPGVLYEYLMPYNGVRDGEPQPRQLVWPLPLHQLARARRVANDALAGVWQVGPRLRGAAAPAAHAPFGIYVDWDNDGAFAASYDNVTNRVLRRTPPKMQRGRDQVRSLAPPAAGSFDAELNNQSRDYSFEYESSPLVGLLYPGRGVKALGVLNNTSPALWQGILDDIPQHPEPSRKSVDIPALGALSRLRARQQQDSGAPGISTQLYGSIRTDVALGYLLDAIGWPSADRVLDTGRFTLTWWWLNNADPWTAMTQLLAVEGAGAAIYEDAQGRLVFEGGNFRGVTGRSLNVQATFRDTGVTPLFQGIEFSPRLQDVINICNLTVNARTAKATAVVWSYGALTIAASATVALVVTSGDPFQGALDPVAGVDYTVTAGSLTSATLSRTSGQSTVLTLVAGAGGATLTGLQVRADPVTIDETTDIEQSVDNTESVDRYGNRPYTVSAWPEITVADAQTIADNIVSGYQQPRPVAKIQVALVDDAVAQTVFGAEISSRYHLVEAQTGIDDDYSLEQISIEFSEGVVWATLGLEKIVPLASPVGPPADVDDVAIGHNTTPFITAYPWSSVTGFGTKYTNPGTLPVNNGNGVAFGGTADVAVAVPTTPFVAAYPWTPGVGFGTKYGDPATLPAGVGRAVAFAGTADVSVAHSVSPFVTAYPWTPGSGFGTKYSNPATLPASLSGGVAFGGTADVAVVDTTTPYVLAYPWTPGSGFGTKYTNPATLPAGNGNGVAFAGTREVAVAHSTTPFVSVYPWTHGLGFGTKYTNPGTLPAGTGNGVAFSDPADPLSLTADVALAHTTTPFSSVYPWTFGSGFGTKYTNPATLPAGQGNGVAFAGTSSLALAHTTTPFVSAYPWTPGLGFGTKYTNPATLPAGTGNAVAFA